MKLVVSDAHEGLKAAVTRVLRATTNPARMRYLALYDMNRADDARRTAFLDRVRKEMEVF